MVSIIEIARTIGMLGSSMTRKLNGEFKPHQTAWAKYYIDGTEHYSTKPRLCIDVVDVRGFNPFTRKYKTWVMFSDHHEPGEILYFHEKMLMNEPVLND